MTKTPRDIVVYVLCCGGVLALAVAIPFIAAPFFDRAVRRLINRKDGSCG